MSKVAELFKLRTLRTRECSTQVALYGLRLSHRPVGAFWTYLCRGPC
jgi:hypothetical protein